MACPLRIGRGIRYGLSDEGEEDEPRFGNVEIPRRVRSPRQAASPIEREADSRAWPSFPGIRVAQKCLAATFA